MPFFDQEPLSPAFREPNCIWAAYSKTEPGRYKSPEQFEFKFFWPLTEQIPLDLNTSGCDTRIRVTLASNSLVTTNNGWVSTLSQASLSAKISVPDLTVSVSEPVGEITIGGMKVEIDKQPTLIQKVLYKLLGFNWKNNV